MLSHTLRRGFPTGRQPGHRKEADDRWWRKPPPAGQAPSAIVEMGESEPGPRLSNGLETGVSPCNELWGQREVAGHQCPWGFRLLNLPRVPLYGQGQPIGLFPGP